MRFRKSVQTFSWKEPRSIWEHLSSKISLDFLKTFKLNFFFNNLTVLLFFNVQYCTKYDKAVWMAAQIRAVPCAQTNQRISRDHRNTVKAKCRHHRSYKKNPDSWKNLTSSQREKKIQRKISSTIQLELFLNAFRKILWRRHPAFLYVISSYSAIPSDRVTHVRSTPVARWVGPGPTWTGTWSGSLSAHWATSGLWTRWTGATIKGTVVHFVSIPTGHKTELFSLTSAKKVTYLKKELDCVRFLLFKNIAFYRTHCRVYLSFPLLNVVVSRSVCVP
jgi:hypothetical protein